MPLLCLTAAGLLCAPAGYGSDDEEEFVVVNAGRVIPVDGDEIARGTVVIVDGRIRSVGKGIDYPKNAEVISAPTETVMPGWVHPHSRWGLSSYARSGVHGDLSAADEFFPEKDRFEHLLEAGYILVTLYPDGSGAPGRAVVVRTAEDVDERVVTSPSYLRVTMSNVPGDKKTLRDALTKAKQEIEKVEKARKEFEEKQKKAKEEAAKKEKEPATQPAPDGEAGKTPATQPTTQPAEAKFEPPKIDPAHQVFVDLIQAKEGVFALVEVSSPSNLLHLEDAIKGYEFAHHLFVPIGYYTDFTCLADKLGQDKTKIVAQAGVSRLPYTVTRVNLPARLIEAGCQVSLVPHDDTRESLRTFRAQLADLVRAGLTREDALRAVTLRPAELLGLNTEYGSLAKDKAGDLVFFEGDPLDPLSRVTRVMVGGKIVYQREDDDR